LTAVDSQTTGDAVGQLAIADATLCELLCDILGEISGRET
jgi:hypothetical protein